MGPRSDEGKIARTIINALDKAEVKEGAIAYMLTGASTVIQKRLWKIFMYLVSFWAVDFDADIYDPEATNMVVNSKRIHEVMERYGQMFD
jgi:hypothetical protein